MSLHLNWREISALTQLYGKIHDQHLPTPGRAGVISPQTALFVDKVIIPERPRFPESYVKGEWALRLSSRKTELIFLFSVRATKTYFAFLPAAKSLKNANRATHSAFDLALSKYLKGSRVLGFEALHQERVVVLWFSGEQSERLGLVLSLIPASPEALLIRTTSSESISYSEDYSVLARSRQLRNDAPYRFPDGQKAPQDLPLREDRLGSVETFQEWIESEIDIEAFELRKRALEKNLKEKNKQAIQRLRQSETMLTEAQAEPDWDRLGNCLKAAIHLDPPVIEEVVSAKGGSKTVPVRQVYDFEAEKTISIPCDPKLEIKEQVEKFFRMSKRKARRIQEASSRQSGFIEAKQRFEAGLAELSELEPSDWKTLEKLEGSAGIAIGNKTAPVGESRKNRGGVGAWLGKSFISKEGLPIWIGRSRDENLELTFKHSKGNDLWMHVKGRPGAHTLIPLRDRKSASLDTLLDAAVLTLYYSGGESWGKTEVDYTFKKYVKRIKDSKEASYTHNKTLIVEPDPERLNRLLSKSE